MTSTPDELSVSDSRDHFTEVLSRATYTGQITYITKRGRRVAAIVPVEVAEAAEDAEDAYLSGLAAEADAELAAGASTRALGEVLVDLGLIERPVVPQQKHGRPVMPETESTQRS